MKIYVAHSSKWDFIKKLYNPIKESKIVKENHIIFPHDEINKEMNSKRIIKESDLVIAEVSLPTTGLGIELGWADYAQTPILCIYQEGYQYTSSLKFITDYFIEYKDEVDMINKIEKFLKNFIRTSK